MCPILLPILLDEHILSRNPPLDRPIVTKIKMSIRLLYLLLGNLLSIVDNVTKLRKRSQSVSEHLILWKSISEGLLLNILPIIVLLMAMGNLKLIGVTAL